MAESKQETQGKTYRTLTQVMQAPARESMPIIARIAPAIERIVTKTGILKLMFSNTVALASNQRAMAKLSEKKQAEIRAEMEGIGEQAVSALLKSLGDCMPEYEEILAAINGVSVDELLDNYSMSDIVNMIKTIVSDNGFLSSLRTLTD